MILLVDIGNTRTKYINVKGIDNSQSSVIENKTLNDKWLNNHWLCYKKIIIASVNSTSMTGIVETWALANKIKVTVIKSEAERFGITTGYHNPAQLGVDRWLALLGAGKLYPKQNVLIIDAGTATTIECLSATGQHHGGWIIPGIDVMFDSLLTKTVNIDANKQNQPKLSFGADSSECVNNGCWAATIATIQLAIERAKILFDTVDIIIFTGGNAKLLAQLSNSEAKLVNNLIFHGLSRYLNDKERFESTC